MDSSWRRSTYSRCAFAAPDSTSSRSDLRTCSSASRSRCRRSASSRRSRTSSVSSRDTLSAYGRLGRPAGGVGQGAGLVDRAQEPGRAPVVAAQLEDLLDHGAVGGLQLADPSVALDGVRVGGHLDAQPGAVGAARPGLPAVHPGELHGGHAVRHPGPARDVGDGADRGEVPVVARDEQDLLALLGADLGGRHHEAHPGEDHVVVDGDQQQLGHLVTPSLVLGSCYKC